jgi:hypothetical protein
MARIEIPKKIRTEDFTTDEQTIIAKISDPFNDLADAFYFALTKSIDFENLNRDLVTVNVNIGATGQVSNLPQVRHSLQTGAPRGVNVIRAINSKSPNTVFPTGAPFLSYTVVSQNVIQVLAVTGLQNNSQYVLTLELIG